MALEPCSSMPSDHQGLTSTGKSPSVVQKEHIQTIVFSADWMSWKEAEPFAQNSQPVGLTHQATDSSSKVDPFLDKPKQQRMVSYENMKELSAKLQDIMNVQTERNPVRNSSKGPHPVVLSNQPPNQLSQDLDEAIESWDPRSNGGFSSFGLQPPPHNRQGIAVIPEPPEYDSSPASVPSNASSSRKRHRQPISRNDVVRMRHWGRRVRWNPQLLMKPPRIQTQTFVSE